MAFPKLACEEKKVLAVRFRSARTPFSSYRYCCARGMNCVVRSTELTKLALVPRQYPPTNRPLHGCSFSELRGRCHYFF
jgi:predicted metal-binding transcription factor (methanogenesis marker protein 9)